MSSTKQNQWKFYLALIAGFAALGTHFYLSKHYYELNLGLSSGPAVCNINSTFNCDTVSASQFSTLFGIPMALWGFTTQLILLLWTLVFGLGLSSQPSRMGRYTFYLSFYAALVSIVMGSLSLLFLKSYCLFCIFAYILSFIHLYALWSWIDTSPLAHWTEDFIQAFKEFKWIGITALSIIPLAFLFNNMFLDHFGGSLLKDTVESSVSGWQYETKQNTFNPNEGLAKGPADAKMVIVEFADFLCSHCKHAAPTLKLFTDSHPDVRLVFKAFPLDGACNADPQMPKGDGTRCLLTKTVFCAEKLAQKGWFFYEKIFELQEKLYVSTEATTIIKSLAEGQGMDLKALEECRNQEDIHKSILVQSEEGKQAGIEGTPSIFVNGKYLSRGQLLPVLQKVYDSLK